MSKRGRPSAPPTPEERAKVLELIEVGAPIADIAVGLGRSIPTLRKYFSAELFSGKKIKGKAEPPFKITDMMREKVARYIGCKMTPAQVAKVVGCTEAQLTEFFADEIDTGGARFRAKVIDNLVDQMTGGAAGATKTLEAITAVPEGEPGAGAQGAHLGKKAAAGVAAKAAAAQGGKFAPRQAPKIVVNNG